MTGSFPRSSRIGWVQIAGPHSGGHRYGESVRRAVNGPLDVTLEDIRSHAGPLRPIVMQARLAALRKRGGYDVLILDNAAALALPLPRKPKHIVLIHHIDWGSIASRWERALFSALEPLCLRHLRNADQVVTVCKFWEDRVRAAGNPRVRTIYNAFDEADFQVRDEEVAALRARHGLTKPIVYIGNCQEAKGAGRSYDALRDLDVHLVTSGRRLLDIPARHLDLGYRDYLTLLRASSVVVTMSLFDEGWCRTAHEAMLLRRPVVGSGRGGMTELLEGGKQVICPRFDDLRDQVGRILSDAALAARMGDDGYQFARTFTTERFRDDWLQLLSGV